MITKTEKGCKQEEREEEKKKTRSEKGASLCPACEMMVVLIHNVHRNRDVCSTVPYSQRGVPASTDANTNLEEGES
jgi:acetyl-CoA carboxylase beta subunit